MKQTRQKSRTKQHKLTYFTVGVLMLVLVLPTLAIPFRPRGNIEGWLNFTNSSVRNGTVSVYNITDFYQINSTLYYGNSTWKHQQYPVSCPTGYCIQALGDITTCTVNRDPSELNLTVQAGNYTDIQAKLRLCPSRLKIPAGNYSMVGASLNITCGNIIIEGEGKQTIITRQGASSAVLRPTNSYTTIRDLAIDCNGRYSGIASVQYDGVDHIVIDNVDIYNTNSTAIMLGASTCTGSACIDPRNSDYDQVINSRLINVQDGIGVWGKGTKIIGNTIIGTGNRFVDEAQADKNYGEGIDVNVRGYSENSTATIIMGNNIANFSEELIDANGGWSVISGNVLDGTPYKHLDSTRCVEIGDTWMASFTGNTVRNCMNMSLRLSTVSGSTITGNTFSGMTSGIGISLENSDYTTIIGNTFKNLSIGIKAQTGGNDNNIIEGNAFDTTVATKASLNTTDTDNTYQITKTYYYKGNFSRNVTAPYFLGTATTASDLTCTDCIGTTEITDSYFLNTGDTLTGRFGLIRGTTLNINNTGWITVTGAYHGVDTNGSANQSLNCIAGGSEGDIIYLKQNGADTRDIIFKYLNCAASTASRIKPISMAHVVNDAKCFSTQCLVKCFNIGANGWLCSQIYDGVS